MVAREVDRQVRLLCSARHVWQGCAAVVVYECLCTLWTMLVGFDVCHVLYDICGVSRPAEYSLEVGKKANT